MRVRIMVIALEEGVIKATSENTYAKITNSMSVEDAIEAAQEAVREIYEEFGDSNDE